MSDISDIDYQDEIEDCDDFNISDYEEYENDSNENDNNENDSNENDNNKNYNNIEIDMDTDYNLDIKKKLSTTESKIIPIKKKTKDNTKDNTKNNTKNDDNTTMKLTKVESQFEFNQENIDYFSKDLDPIKIFIKKSPFADNSKDKSNDTKIMCLLLKYKLIKDYKCNIPKCKVKNVWTGKSIQLLLNRKNGINNDLTIENLEFLCANCYMCLYGLEIFKKKEKETILKCNICDFPMVKFANSRKKTGICLACEKKMNSLSYEKVQSSYYNQLQEVYNHNPTLSDDIHRPRHYKDLVKFKKNNSSNIKNKNNSNGDNTTNKNPIIQLNMTIPDLTEILDI